MAASSRRISSTISFYLGRQFVGSFLLIFSLFIGIILVIDLIELLRRSASKEEATFDLVLSMAVYKLPLTAQKTLPFAVLFGGMLSFWRLNRTSELVALRAAGVSVWQFMFPALAAALLAGIFKVALINPLSTVMISRFEQLENRYLRGRTELMAASSSGVWLRQVSKEGHTVIFAKSAKITDGQVALFNVIALRYLGQDRFAGRIDAREARLVPNAWLLRNVRISDRDQPTRKVASFRIPTTLTLEKIQDSFSSPSTISFWELPSFIRSLEATGFSALEHRLHWHSLLSEPALYCAMILIAAIFSLRHNRRAGILLAVSGGIAAGFLLFFVSDLILALAHSTGLPPVLAAWSPALASMFVGVAVLLHVEDG